MGPLARLAAGVLALLAVAAPLSPALAQAIVVGGRASTEQQVLTEMTVQLLRAKGFAADKRTGLAAAALRGAQEGAQVDVAWDYTGAALIALKVADRLDAAASYAKVRELDAGKGLVWLNPSRANATSALAMRAIDLKGVSSLSNLAAKVKGGEAFRLGCSAEFAARPDGLGPLQAAYGFEFGRENVVRMDAGLVYGALRDRQVDVGVVLATDGRVPALGLTILRDDKGFFPSYALAPVVRREVLDRNPRLAEALNALSARLDDGVMAKLNAGVDVDRKTVEEVAASFLKGMALI